MLCHPTRASKMGVVALFGRGEVRVRVQRENTPRGLFPIDLQCVGVEQLQINRHVSAIIGCQPIAVRWRIGELVGRLI